MLHPYRSCARAHRFRGGAYTPRPQSLRPCCCFHLEDKANILPIFPPRKRKNIFLPFFAHLCVSLLPRCSARSSSRVSPAAQLRPVHYLLLRPFHKQKNAGPRHCAANPLTTKSVDFSLKKNARRHAWLTRSCFGRKNLFIDGPHCPFSFLLFYKGKEKENRSKFSRFEYIARTHFVRPHDVRDWPVAPRPLKFM